MEFMSNSQQRKTLSLLTTKITADIITDYGMQVKISKTRGMCQVICKSCGLQILQLKVGKKQCNEVRKSFPVFYKWSF